MGYLIDTNILIDAERKIINIAKHIKGKKEELFYISVISISELLHGIHRAKNMEIKNRRAVFVESIINQFPYIGVDIGVARIHARIWAELIDAGKMIGAHDLWLAATALENDLILVSGNQDEFTRIPGLKTECWQ